MTDNDRAAMAAKINALLSKTVENGATEAEAMMAMHKATELMSKYEFNLTGLEIESQGIDTLEIPMNKNSIHNFTGIKLAMSIAQLTETRVWRSFNPERIVFFGLKPDLIFAKWVYETLCNFCTQEADRWWKEPANYIPSTIIKSAAERTKIKVSFISGAITRISQTIDKEVRERKEARENKSRGASTGTALVAIGEVKKAAVDKAFANLGMKLKKAKSSKARYYEHASSSGYAAGAKASWTKPINNGGEVKRIK